MEILLGLMIGFAISHFIIKPIEAHKIGKELMARGYPPSPHYKKHIWW